MALLYSGLVVIELGYLVLLSSRIVPSNTYIILAMAQSTNSNAVGGLGRVVMLTPERVTSANSEDMFETVVKGLLWRSHLHHQPISLYNFKPRLYLNPL